MQQLLGKWNHSRVSLHSAEAVRGPPFWLGDYQCEKPAQVPLIVRTQR